MAGKDEAKAKLQRWKADPVAFVREVFKIEPDGWQHGPLQAFAQHNRIGMKACKNPGKTAVLAWLCWLFALTRKHSKVIATSISGPNLKDGLWTELAKWQKCSPLLQATFTWGATTITQNDHPETWFMAARQWKESATPEQQADTLAGKHADNILFVLDEVGGIPDAVMVAADAALGSGKDAKILMAGNPTQCEGPLYRACTDQAKLWKMFEVTGDPDDPNRAPRVDLKWAREAIENWGRDHPWVMANVLGKFPPKSSNSLLGPDEVSEAMKRHLSTEAYGFSQKRIGIDVAAMGDDRTILFPRQGLASFRPVGMFHARPSEIAARVVQAKSKWQSEMEFVDDTGGYGGGVIDALNQAGVAAVPVNASGRAIDPRFFNRRSEMWWRMAEWVKKGGALPEDGDLRRELTTPTYRMDGGKLRIEEKAEVKKRLGYSPDKADALALTFAIEDLPAAMGEMAGRGMAGRVRTEADVEAERTGGTGRAVMEPSDESEEY